jgi:type I restriction-modification system DNA methylase subunit
MSEEQKRLLEQQLWAIADLLRGKMNADEYKKLRMQKKKPFFIFEIVDQSI